MHRKFLFQNKSLLQKTLKFSLHTKKLIAAIDQSTTGSKLAIFDFNGHLISQNLIPHRQITKHSGWLEHDPSEILQNIKVAIEDTLKDLHEKVLFFCFISKKYKDFLRAIPKIILLVWESQIKEKPLFVGIRTLENLIIMRLFGVMQGQKRFVKEW